MDTQFEVHSKLYDYLRALERLRMARMQTGEMAYCRLVEKTVSKEVSYGGWTSIANY